MRRKKERMRRKMRSLNRHANKTRESQGSQLEDGLKVVLSIGIIFHVPNELGESFDVLYRKRQEQCHVLLSPILLRLVRLAL